jgi:glycosyltransferase involved in cell wall biosynthesis
MKIGIEGQRLFRKKKHGMDFVAMELVKNLQAIDNVNEYCVFVQPGPDECLQSSGNIKIIKLEGASYPIWEQFALPNAARKSRCDLLHCTSNTGPLWGSVPVLLTLHDIFYLESLSLVQKGFTNYQKFGNMYRRSIVPSVVKKSRKIVTVSLSEKIRISKFFKIYDDRLAVIHNGVGTHFTPVTDSATLKKTKTTYGLPEKFILLLGNTDPKKNTEGAVVAYSKFLQLGDSSVSLVIADFSESHLTEILVKQKLSPIRPKIICLDYIHNPDLPAIYSLSSLFLYPSFWESFGIPILEAMSCGTPVITSNVYAMPEIAGDAALLIDPGDPDEIAMAIFRLMNEQDLNKQMIEKGKRQITKFSWKKMAQEYLETYSEIIFRLK